MRSFLFALLALLVACTPRPATCHAPAAQPGSTASLSQDNTDFAADLYAQLADGGTGNLVSSPFSVSEALAMTSAGAAGRTAAQIAQVLHFAGGPADAHPAFGALDCAVIGDGESSGNALHVANGLWGQKGASFTKPFLGTLQDDYGAPLQQKDFIADAEGARKDINGWVSDHTAGKILDLFAPGAIDSGTRLVLANAIYFKGAWAQKFDASQTRAAPFTRPDGSTVDAQLMHQTAHFGVAQPGGLTVLEMPYQSGKLAMDVFLPAARDGLPALEAELTADNLGKWLGALGTREVQVAFPRFEVSARFDLGHTLAAMGMPDAFDPGAADFSGMDGAHDLFIGVVVHQAWIHVDEQGTEAAAATGLGMGTTAMEQSDSFVADHPFVFAIRDLSSRSLLFLGRVTDPTAG